MALDRAGPILLAFRLPWQVYRIATDPRLRRNHALEHATLHVMAEHREPPMVDGMAVRAGFVLRGWIDPHRILAAAAEGLRRLQQGETSLAWHRRCGTSLGTAELLIWLALAAALLFAGRLSAPAVLVIPALAWLAGPWVGQAVQRYLTTSADVGRLEVRGLTVKPLPAPPRPAAAPPSEAGTGAFWGEAVVLVHHRGTDAR